MKKLLLILGLSLGLATQAAKAEVFYIPIQLDMQMGRGLKLDDGAKRLRNNNTESIIQLGAYNKFDTLKECELFMLDIKRNSGDVMEYYGNGRGMGFVWNNYASDNTTIVQQSRCLRVNLLSID